MASPANRPRDLEDEDLELEEEEESERPRPYARRQQEGGPAPGGARRGEGGPRFRPRRKVCSFCVDKVQEINYKDVDMIRRFLDDHAKILPRRKTGTCARHQRRLAGAIKQARHLALLPFVTGRSPYD